MTAGPALKLKILSVMMFVSGFFYGVRVPTSVGLFLG
jgi:hypothetical protein